MPQADYSFIPIVSVPTSATYTRCQGRLPIIQGRQALHELGASAVHLRPIIGIDEERFDLGKALTNGLPPGL
jgi:hypothetical protein